MTRPARPTGPDLDAVRDLIRAARRTVSEVDRARNRTDRRHRAWLLSTSLDAAALAARAFAESFGPHDHYDPGGGPPE